MSCAARVLIKDDCRYLDLGNVDEVLPPWVKVSLKRKPRVEATNYVVIKGDEYNITDTSPDRVPLGVKVIPVYRLVDKPEPKPIANIRYPFHPSEYLRNLFLTLVEDSGVRQSDLLRQLIVKGAKVADSHIDIRGVDLSYTKLQPTYTIRLNVDDSQQVESARLKGESTLALSSRLVYLGLTS